MVRFFRYSGLISCLFIIAFYGCRPANGRLDVDVSNIDLPQIVINRYDIDLFKVNHNKLRQELEMLKPSYRFFLDTDLSDTAKLSDMTNYLENPRTIAFHEAVVAKYKNLDLLSNDLTNAYRHYLNYYPGRTVPRVYTYISGGDYDFPIQFADSVLLIGLDNYLGNDFKPYLSDGLPAYRVERMDQENILPDCMKLLANATHPVQLPGNNLLEQMIEAGKRLYFIDAMIPATEDRLKIGYSKAQNEWIAKHESDVWAAIIQNGLLYTTNGKLIRSFMADGPFTAEFSNEAPSRLGEWLGWQIVRKYMNNNTDVTLQELMSEKDAQKILSLSGYKPGK